MIFVYCFVICLTYARKYNILSMDGGAIKGIITQQCLIEVESYAYNYSMSKGYDIP